jgi:hypothetical protein
MTAASHLRMGWNCQSVYSGRSMWAESDALANMDWSHATSPSALLPVAGTTAIGLPPLWMKCTGTRWCRRPRSRLSAIYDTDELLALITRAARYRRLNDPERACVQPAADEERLPVWPTKFFHCITPRTA